MTCGIWIKILAENFTFQVTALAYVLLCPEAVDAGQVGFNFSTHTNLKSLLSSLK